MRSTRRLFAALCGATLLQLVLLDGGTLCGMHQGGIGDGAPTDAMSMAGMHHHGNLHTAAPTNADAAQRTTADASQGHDGCQLPFAPGQCSSMAACTLTVAPAATVATHVGARAIGLTLPSPAPGRAGPTFAPELPPPRA